MGKIRSVLFICTGNICRSPTAEGVLRALASRKGVALRVESAGTHGYHVGEPPDERAQRHARSRGYDLSRQRARRVAPRDFRDFDLILAMDRDHLAILERACPAEHRHKLRTLIDGRDVPDPYYGGPEGFEHVLDLVEAACGELLAGLATS